MTGINVNDSLLRTPKVMENSDDLKVTQKSFFGIDGSSKVFYNNRYFYGIGNIVTKVCDKMSGLMNG